MTICHNEHGLIRILMSAIALLAGLSGLVRGEKPLSQGEILAILENLTRVSVENWIEWGTIQARHEEFKAAWVTDPNQLDALVAAARQEYLDDDNKPEQTDQLQQARLRAIPFNVRYEQGNEFKMVSRETVWRDRGRFVWDRQVLERQDSIIPPDDGNPMYDYFNTATNGHRINSWDGKVFVVQNPQVRSAQVYESGLGVAPVTDGPERAGIVPWGRGIYTLNTLSKKIIGGIDRDTTVELTFQISADHVRKFVLDKMRGYALREIVATQSRVTTISQYSDYIQFENRWVPQSIRIDSFRTSSGDFTLYAYHLWTVERMAPLPDNFSFVRQFENDTLIQYQLGRGRSYRYLASTAGIDTDALLRKKLEMEALPASQPRNCATACLDYTLQRMGQTVEPAELTSLISPTTGTTRFFDMAQFLQKRHLTTQAVIAPLQELARLTQCQVILNYPQDHFCLLGPVDDQFVRLIDLSQPSFFYRVDREAFETSWSGRTALIVSAGAIATPAQAKPVDDEALKSITGSQVAACSTLVQKYRVVFCPPAQMGVFQGYYKVFYERWQCTPLPGEVCNEELLLLRSYIACAADDYNPDQCTVSGDWNNIYEPACRQPLPQNQTFSMFTAKAALDDVVSIA